MNANNKYHRSILQSIAHRAMLERGLLPDFSNEALAELERLQTPEQLTKDPPGIRDMRNLLWASIDDDIRVKRFSIKARIAARGTSLQSSLT